MLNGTNMVYRLAVGLTLLAACVTMTRCKTPMAAQGPVYLIKIESGDTLHDIAAKYDTNLRSITRLNRLDDADDISVGQIIRVVPGPGGRVADEIDAPATSSKSLLFGTGANTPKNNVESAKPRGGLLFGSTVSSAFTWPLRGKISSFYGNRWGRFHHGIDIRANRGSKIRAAAAGKVIFASRQRGFGKVVKIKHNTYTTVYGHCHRLLVKKGRWVGRGDAIATVGTTGNATGPHLHLEIRNSRDKSIDPLTLMPSRKLLSRR